MSSFGRRRVMVVTGGSGFLGHHLVQGNASADWRIITPTSQSMNITDRQSTIDTIVRLNPDVVVHLAYRKDDPLVIVDGTRHVVEATVAARARLIHMSTDVVFAGRPTPYVESDLPDAITDYGVQKSRAEAAVLAVAPGATIIRTSLLYGTDHPSPFQIALATGLRAGASPMTFFTDEFRCPAHADDVATAISHIAAHDGFAGLLHVAGPEAVSRLDFAAALAKHAGLGDVPLPTTSIAESGMTRAGNVVLDSSLAISMGIGCRSLSDTLSS